MKAKLLKKLRAEASSRFVIESHTTTTGLMYAIYDNCSRASGYCFAVDSLDIATSLLTGYRRSYILGQISLARWKTGTVPFNQSRRRWMLKSFEPMNIEIRNGECYRLVPEEYLTEQERIIMMHYNHEQREREYHDARMKVLNDTQQNNMTVYYVEETLSFPDFECRGSYKRVSDYFRNKEDAEQYMKEHYRPEQYEGGWSTIHVRKEEIVIR